MEAMSGLPDICAYYRIQKARFETTQTHFGAQELAHS
jgi:hypothetical protein